MAFKISNSDAITNGRGLVSSQISMFPHSLIEVLDPPSSTLTPAWGTTNGFAIGGLLPTGPNTMYNDIDRFPFASDINATDVGDMLYTLRGGAGNQSTTHGYHSGGEANAVGTVTTTTLKFPLTAPSITSSGVNNLNIARFRVGGVSSGVAAYCVAGHGTIFSPAVSHTEIEKFPFAAEAYVSYVGEITANLAGGFGSISSADAGYITGGVIAVISPPAPAPTSAVSTIQKFSFATDGNMNAVGDLTTARGLTTSASAPTAGYTMGGVLTPTLRYNIIDKFPYVNEGKATDVGDLIATIGTGGSVASTTNGYHLGGAEATAPGAPPTTITNRMEKFPFASDTNATDIADLTRAKVNVVGVVD